MYSEYYYLFVIARNVVTKQSAKIELPWESLGVQIASIKSVRNDVKGLVIASPTIVGRSNLSLCLLVIPVQTGILLWYM
jgi:hypothetical protein